MFIVSEMKSVLVIKVSMFLQFLWCRLVVDMVVLFVILVMQYFGYGFGYVCNVVVVQVCYVDVVGIYGIYVEFVMQVIYLG